ncbi:hypothetical protein RvY_00935 [Ramazzottius varieornatus]|uniref:t-SNARE coiled-coil homology domain-containing protein n=1 Tax=Ramazzottius varieornatus TaxID=947166 RepID=A0A1D1UFF6_RAMVA|nr:hypothetical protein RvY_00935 [Ramazzottius varieornatus]
MEKSKSSGPFSRGGAKQASRNFFDADNDDDYSSYFKKKSSNPFDDEDDWGTPASPVVERGKFTPSDQQRAYSDLPSRSNYNYGSRPLNLQASPTEVPFSQQETYQQKIQAINDRTLATTTRSLQLIDESEAVGTAAAQELLAQREQLENASKNLDNMNATLDQSQKHINHIRSVFGGIKNWWSSKGSAEVPTNSPPSSQSSDKLRAVLETSPYATVTDNSMRSVSLPNDLPRTQLPQRNTAPPFREPLNPRQQAEVALDQNLDHMSAGLSRLKMLAEGLGGEIESQNKLLDNINPKAEKVEAKMGEQQKLINRILGKK